jgi:flagellin-specific chaperone FliS
MNPYKAYQQTLSGGQTRIDTTLALYEAAIDRLEKATTLLGTGNTAAAGAPLASVRLIVGALASAVSNDAGELAGNLLRLFEFVTHCVASAQSAQVAAAAKVLRTLYEGFIAIRPEALRLERAGTLPPLDRACSIHLSA